MVTLKFANHCVANSLKHEWILSMLLSLQYSTLFKPKPSNCSNVLWNYSTFTGSELQWPNNEKSKRSTYNKFSLSMYHLVNIAIRCM